MKDITNAVRIKAHDRMT